MNYTSNGSVSKREAAAMLGVHRNTITNWLNAGELHTDGEGRIALTDIERTAQRLRKIAQESMADIHRRWKCIRIYRRGRKNWPW